MSEKIAALKNQTWIYPIDATKGGDVSGPHVFAHTNAYPLRRLARVFGFVGFASLTYSLAIVGIAIEAAIIEF